MITKEEIAALAEKMVWVQPRKYGEKIGEASNKFPEPNVPCLVYYQLEDDDHESVLFRSINDGVDYEWTLDDGHPVCFDSDVWSYMVIPTELYPIFNKIYGCNL